MAPTTHSDDKLKTQKHRLVRFKNRPHPSCSVPPQGPTENRRMVRSVTDVKPPENYENLLLFYLTKLKNLFSNPHPARTARENSAVRMRKLHQDHCPRSASRGNSLVHPCRYTSSNPPKPREHVQSEVYNVVLAALEYGFANNVLEKKGDCFILKNRRHNLATRQPTPGPRYCEKCCNVHRCIKNTPEDYFPRISDRNKPMPSCYERSLHTTQQGKVERNYRDRLNRCTPQHERFRFQHNMSQPEFKKKDSLKANVIHCPDCRALERVRK